MDAGQTRALLSDIAMMEHHLLYNHYPPYDRAAVPYALKAVERAAEAVLMDDDQVWNEEIECPNGTTTVRELCEAFHLDDFVAAKVAELEAEGDESHESE